MKTLRKLIAILLTLCLFSGCTKNNQPAENESDIAGKTYYDTADTFIAKDPSEVWFGKDGSFVLKDSNSDGYYELSGKWKIEKGVVTCEVENGKFDKVIFEVQDENNLVLKTTLTGSNSDTVFSTTKPTSSGSPVTTIDNTSDYHFKKNMTFYNASQDRKLKSFVDIRTDGSFTLIDYSDTQTLEINGLYGLTDDGSVVMFSNFNPFEDMNGKMVYNFEMAVLDENTLLLMEDLIDSKYIDYFTVDAELPDDAKVDSPISGFTTTTWIHEPIQDVNDMYLPTLTIATDYSFEFVENVYAGMGKYKGWCQRTDDACWICDVTDASMMQGFAGDDVKVIEFEDKGDKSVVLKTDLCMSRAGDVFTKK